MTEFLHPPTNFQAAESDNEQFAASTILSIPLAATIAVIAGILSYHGASERPALVPSPVIAASVVGICLFLLLFPFTRIRRDVWGIVSPEAMGGIGYLIYIGVGAATNHIFPGLAVNPSLFGYLPAGILAQTAGAMAFYVGTLVAMNWGYARVDRQTQPNRLAFLMLAYAGFALYLSFLVPKIDANDLLQMVRAGESVSWIFTVGQFIVLQSLPMIVAAQVYLRGLQFASIRYAVIAVLGFAAFVVLVSGSRTYAVQTVLLLFIARALAMRRIEKTLLLAVVVGAISLLILSTSFRLDGKGAVTFNPTTTGTSGIISRAGDMVSASSIIDINDVLTNFRDNIVYHLSDNQTIAMLIKHYDSGPLLGNATLSSLLSALPSGLRPDGYTSGTNQILSHFRFYKEPTTDAFYLPDWQISIGALGFADFWIFGLLLYPFGLGVALRWIYNRTVLSKGLGEAGWLLYVPLVQMMWNPLHFGPDSSQTLRLIIPLAIGLWWTSVEELSDEDYVIPVIA